MFTKMQYCPLEYIIILTVNFSSMEGLISTKLTQIIPEVKQHPLVWKSYTLKIFPGARILETVVYSLWWHSQATTSGRVARVASWLQSQSWRHVALEPCAVQRQSTFPGTSHVTWLKCCSFATSEQIDVKHSCIDNCIAVTTSSETTQVEVNDVLLSV